MIDRQSQKNTARKKERKTNEKSEVGSAQKANERDKELGM